MITPALNSVTVIYDIAADVTETVHLVSDPATENLYKTSKRLQRHWHKIGSDDAHLMDALQKLAWMTNLAVSTPLPLGHPGLVRFCSPDELLGLLQHSGVSYPECSALVRDTAHAFDQALPLEITGLGVKVCELVEQHDHVAILTGREWLNSTVQEHVHSITGRSDVKLIRSSDFRKNEVYDVVIITSPPSWIRPQVRNAIRARERDIVTLSLFQMDSPPASVLPQSWKPLSTVRRSQRADSKEVGSHEEIEVDITVQDVSEGFELASFLARIQTESSNAAPTGEYAPLGDAEAFQLADGSVVLLSADGKTWTVEQVETEFQVEHAKPADIDPGDFIILRTRRDRELLAEIADRILGPRATHLRQMQSDWKRYLLTRVELCGLTGVARELRSLGLGSLATPMNVRRWTSDGFIRNQKYESWLIIMKYLGFESAAEGMWSDMEQIVDAHRQAGYRISNVIKTKLETLSLDALRDSMELPSMPELGEERLTLYLVQERLGHVRDVRFTDMNKTIQW